MFVRHTQRDQGQGQPMNYEVQSLQKARLINCDILGPRERPGLINCECQATGGHSLVDVMGGSGEGGTCSKTHEVTHRGRNVSCTSVCWYQHLGTHSEQDIPSLGAPDKDTVVL